MLGDKVGHSWFYAKDPVNTVSIVACLFIEFLVFWEPHERDSTRGDKKNGGANTF